VVRFSGSFVNKDASSADYESSATLMILYEAGDYHVGFIWQLEGSTLPKAMVFGIPSGVLSLLWRWLLTQFPHALETFRELHPSVIWSILFAVLGMLLGFRANKAYSRFWEGTTLVQQMRAEWFEACSNLLAFSKLALIAKPDDPVTKDKVGRFQYTLVRLMSLMHGAALCQLSGGDGGEDFDVLDVHALDDESLDYLTIECGIHEINRVEVLLHWVQVLITDSIAAGVLVAPPPILTRSDQTLSRGMVNLHNVRKLADVPCPFPLSQMIVVLLLIQTFFTPVFVAAAVQSYVGAFVMAFVPIFGMWSTTFASGELEQPFGQDPNDLPLSELQFEMNNSLLMLLDHRAKRSPELKEGACQSLEEMRNMLGDMGSTTSFLGRPPDRVRISHKLRQAKSMKSVRMTELSVSEGATVEPVENEPQVKDASPLTPCSSCVVDDVVENEVAMPPVQHGVCVAPTKVALDCVSDANLVNPSNGKLHVETTSPPFRKNRLEKPGSTKHVVRLRALGKSRHNMTGQSASSATLLHSHRHS
jgi:putative membrane protein